MDDEIKIDELAKSLVLDGIKIRLTKISERDDAEVPNNIPTDSYRIGYVSSKGLKPKIGYAYFVDSIIQINDESVHPGHWFITSQITEIVSENDKEIIFKTLNSIYKIEIL